MSEFMVDKRISEGSFFLFSTQLSEIYLKDEAHFPWLIMVPRVNDIQEIYQLPIARQHTLIDDISKLSNLSSQLFKADKINVGALGNQVSQLHIHIISRFTTDVCWPQGIWQPNCPTQAYTPDEAQKRCQSIVHTWEAVAAA